jgi:superfamily II DNA helicase RecQ
MGFMQCTVYTVPAFDSETELERLNVFLRGNKIYHIGKQFFVSGETAYWSFCVEYEGRLQPQSQGKIDYKERLSEADFAIFSKLRDVRTSCAKEHNIPLYSVFTNEQLVEMISRKISDISGLKQIPGVGKNKIDTYGDVFATFLATVFKPEHETNQ